MKTKRVVLSMMTLVMLLVPRAGAGGPKQEQASLSWFDRITLSGTVESDLTWTDVSDFRDMSSGPGSDLFISGVELGVEAQVNDWISGGVLLLAEDIGTEDETDLAVDQVFVTFDKEEKPFYAVVGKRVLPFGLFESYLVSDPMTQDAYETNSVAFTAGIRGPARLDVSVSAYNGEEMMSHLFESGLFETDDTQPVFFSRTNDPADGDSISSYIMNASVGLEERLTLVASYLSEPGNGSRNDTVGLGVNCGCVLLDGLLIDAEYLFAREREVYAGYTEPFEESVFSATLTYSIGRRPRGSCDQGLTYLLRRAHLFEDPFEVAVRFEHFDDDGMAEQSQTWSVKNRTSAGVRYSFYEDKEALVVAFVGLEYRKTAYRVSTTMAGTVADDSNEIMGRLGVRF